MFDLAIVLLLIASGAVAVFLISLFMFFAYAKRTHHYLRLLRDRWCARVISFPDGSEHIVFLNAHNAADFEDAMHTLALLRYYAPASCLLARTVRVSFLTACLSGAFCFVAFGVMP